MRFFRWLKRCFSKLFGAKDTDSKKEVAIVAEEIDEQKLEQDTVKFKMTNVVFEKLNFLEQYIKTFMSSFPNEYNKYFNIIVNHRTDYQKELAGYRRGLAGEMTLSIDPECEAKRIMAVLELEEEITRFSDFVVSHKLYKDKFSTLCGKLNQFYNALVNHHIEYEQVHRQFKNATNSMQKLIDEVQNFCFFKQDSRKREEILNLVIYCDYLLFKIALRYNICNSFDEYKVSLSKIFVLFVDKEYDRLIFKFFVQDLEHIQEFITAKLNSYESFSFLLQSCNNLQSRIQDFANTSSDYSFFEDVLRLENTLEESAKTVGLDFVLKLPNDFEIHSNTQVKDVNSIAISVLKLIHNGKARLLLEIIKNFKITISWKELYFLCKLFELSSEMIEVAKNTVFNCIVNNFSRLDESYSKYSSNWISEKKTDLLSYNGSQKKKYVLLFSSGQIDYDFAIAELKNLLLDFVIIEESIYINYSYFKGFVNLERIFENYITI